MKYTERLQVLLNHYYPNDGLYTDNTFEKHFEEVKAGKIKSWADQGSHKKCEEVRQALIIKRTKEDYIPQVLDKLATILGYAKYQKAQAEEDITMAESYIKQLLKWKDKKNMTYKDTYKVEDVIHQEPKKVKGTVDKTQAEVIGYIRAALDKKDQEFLNELSKTLNVYLMIGALK